MARKTFISYKFSEAQDLRDAIITALGSDVTFYKGETSESPDMTDLKTSTIKKNLSDMMFNTSVLIVIISPNMKQSKWIDWEIEYCLQNNTRKDRTSQTNGVVAVIKKVNGGYEWFRTQNKQIDGCTTSSFSKEIVNDIINQNRFNQEPMVYSCEKCKCVTETTASYISYVDEETFLSNPNEYIENAFEKSENDAKGYKISKKK